MYAETEREREMLAAQIRASTWNASGPCVSVDVECTGSDAVIPMGKNSIIPMTFTLRNFSLSRIVKCVLDLKPRADILLSSSHLPASYTGQTIFRKTLRPLETCRIRARMLASQPGAYSLGGWVVRCEVAASDKGEWRVGQVYEILPATEDEDVVLVSQGVA